MYQKLSDHLPEKKKKLHDFSNSVKDTKVHLVYSGFWPNQAATYIKNISDIGSLWIYDSIATTVHTIIMRNIRNASTYEFYYRTSECVLYFEYNKKKLSNYV